jgi:hypothetical protein
MTSNPVSSTIVGILGIAAAVAASWGLLMGLEILHGALGEYAQYLLAAPVVGFVAYLVGDGILLNRADKKS